MGKISEIFSDATTLEINSILVDGISGRKMPGIRIAFFETLSAWVGQFEKLIEGLERINIRITDEEICSIVASWRDEKVRLDLGNYDPSRDQELLEKILDTESADAFREKLNTALKGRKEADELMAEINRLMKVQTRLSVLKLSFKDYFGQESTSPKGEVVANRAMQELRKLWELKDGYIFAQNVVQLDGDVISRYNRRIYRDPQTKDKTEQLVAFHNKNVDIGIKHWHFLIDTILSIAKAIEEKITNPFK